MQTSLFRRALPMALASLLLSGAASAATLLEDNFDSDFTWKTLSDSSLVPSAALVVDPSGTGRTSNHVLRFMRENNARVFRDLPAPVSGGVVTIEFRILKTASANTAGLWLTDAAGQGIGFLCELNTPQAVNRVKVLRTTDAAATGTLVKTFANLAPKDPPGEKIWHPVSISWDIARGHVAATIGGQPAGEIDGVMPSGPQLSRVILQGGFPFSLYLDDVRITATP